MTLHATILEVITTVTCAFGVWYTRKNCQDAQRTVIAVALKGLDGSRRLLAKKNARLRYTLLRIEQLLLFVSAVSLFLPPPPYPYLVDALMDREARIGSMLVRGAFMVISIVLARLSRIDHDEEAAMLAYRRDELQRHGRVELRDRPAWEETQQQADAFGGPERDEGKS